MCDTNVSCGSRKRILREYDGWINEEHKIWRGSECIVHGGACYQMWGFLKWISIK